MTRLFTRLIDLVWWLTLVVYCSGGFFFEEKQRLGFIPELVRVCVAFGAVGLFAKVDFRRLSFVEGFKDFADCIHFRRLPRTIAGWSITLSSIYFAACFLVVPLIRHWTFGSWFYDLALMEQVIWRGAHSLGMTSTVLGTPDAPLAYVPNNHLNMWLYPIAWIYRIAPYTETLLMLQSVALLLAFIPLWKIGRLLLEPRGVPAIVLPLIYWCWDTVHRVNVWDFHETPFMAFVGLYAFLFFLQERWVLAAVFTVLMALLKEDAWITAGAMGFYFCVSRKKYAIGVLFAAIGCALFLGHAAFLNKVNTVAERYSYLGDSISSGIRSILQHPAILFEQATKRDSLYLLFRVIFIGAGTWLFSGWAIVPILPTLLICVLSTHPGMLSMESHHIFGLSAPLMFAVAVGIASVSATIKTAEMRDRAVTVVLMISVLQLAFGEPSSIRRALANTSSEQRICLTELTSSIPPNVPVYAYNPLATHVAGRQVLLHYKSGRPIHVSGAYVVAPESDPSPANTKVLTKKCGYKLMVSEGG